MKVIHWIKCQDGAEKQWDTTMMMEESMIIALIIQKAEKQQVFKKCIPKSSVMLRSTNA